MSQKLNFRLRLNIFRKKWNIGHITSIACAQKFPQQSKDQPASSQSTSQRIKKAEGLSPVKESEQQQKATKSKGKK